MSATVPVPFCCRSARISFVRVVRSPGRRCSDVALYGAVLSKIGRVELAVTTSMTINFLRRPAPADLIAEARLLKIGRRLAYGEVLIHSSGSDEPVAHATGTYSIPPVPTGN